MDVWRVTTDLYKQMMSSPEWKSGDEHFFENFVPFTTRVSLNFTVPAVYRMSQFERLARAVSHCGMRVQHGNPMGRDLCSRRLEERRRHHHRRSMPGAHATVGHTSMDVQATHPRVRQNCLSTVR